MSSLADVPILQSLAVTGSVDQLGCVQPVGGVTEEGGGILRYLQRQGDWTAPRRDHTGPNKDSLMLKRELVERCATGNSLVRGAHGRRRHTSF
jgi:hypothetical protein